MRKYVLGFSVNKPRAYFRYMTIFGHKLRYLLPNRVHFPKISHGGLFTKSPGYLSYGLSSEGNGSDFPDSSFRQQSQPWLSILTRTFLEPRFSCNRKYVSKSKAWHCRIWFCVWKRRMRTSSRTRWRDMTRFRGWISGTPPCLSRSSGVAEMLRTKKISSRAGGVLWSVGVRSFVFCLGDILTMQRFTTISFLVIARRST